MVLPSGIYNNMETKFKPTPTPAGRGEGYLGTEGVSLSMFLFLLLIAWPHFKGTLMQSFTFLP